MAKIELYNDNYANWKSYNIPAKAQQAKEKMLAAYQQELFSA